MEELNIDLTKLTLNENIKLYEEIKFYINVIHDKILFSNYEVIKRMDNYWKSLNPFIVQNLVDYINETINNENNEIIKYLKMDLYNYRSNMFMFLDYLMHTVFY